MEGSLAELYPELVNEWNQQKNGTLYPSEVFPNSKEKVWWICEKRHEWKTQVVSRTKKQSKCPYCGGHKAIPGINDVATLYPDLVKEFHPTKNGNIKLEKYKESSGKKVWWACEKGHEWAAVINTRTKRGYKCPICSNQKTVPGVNDFGTEFPELFKELASGKNNGVNINKISKKSKIKLYWRCPRGHEYISSVDKRTIRGDGCPYCSGHKPIVGENDLLTIHPELSLFWNYELNGDMKNYMASSVRKVSWKCDKGHEWINKVANQVNTNKCPFCSGKKLVIGVNDVATKYPELVAEWDVEKNKINPRQVKANVDLSVHWKCSKGHSWKSMIWNRLNGKGCPFCTGKYPIKGENDLATLFPWIKEEWNYELNEKDPEEYLPKSNKKVWWKCENDHIWKAIISDRTNGTGCPKCRR